MTDYKYLTQQQINFITEHYSNQETADDVQELFSELEEVTGLEILTDLVRDEDGRTDLLIFGENDKKEYFKFFCKAPNYLSPSIRGFGKDVETALEIIDSVLAWLEEGEQEQLNSQVLKANYLIDILMNEESNYYLGEGQVEYDNEALEKLSPPEVVEVQTRLKLYSQMLAEITDKKIREIMYKSFDYGLKYELPLLI